MSGQLPVFFMFCHPVGNNTVYGLGLGRTTAGILWSVNNSTEMERAMKELFGQRLREQRQNQGLTMEQLAEKANLSTNFIGAIERGLKEPSLSTLISILNALDIPADVLLRDYVGTASHVTDDEICKRLEGLTPIQKKVALDLLDTYIANLPYLTNEE